jgi:hypothetical protein
MAYFPLGASMLEIKEVKLPQQSILSIIRSNAVDTYEE